MSDLSAESLSNLALPGCPMSLLTVASLDSVIMVSAASRMPCQQRVALSCSIWLHCQCTRMPCTSGHVITQSLLPILYCIICGSFRCLLLPVYLLSELHFGVPLSSCGDLSAGLQSVAPLAASGSGDGVIHGDGPGVLEIKCPFNRGDPNSAAPPKLAQWYYMPQVSSH